MKKIIITAEIILKYVTEEDIFELVFGLKPIEGEYYTSPFRFDTNPGCWFQTDINTNKLRFVDFADSRVINGIRMNNIDCFNAVQVFYKFNNFYSTLFFIKTNLIDNRNLSVLPPKLNSNKIKRSVDILVNTKEFNNRDRNFWIKYGITKRNLIEDNVFSINKFKLLNTKSGNLLIKTKDLCYSFSNFKNNRKKIYRPLQKGKYKFITNCKASDIGEIDSLKESGKQLIISKSYKDCRVLKNRGLNSIWFQNEGMIPSKEAMNNLCNRFHKIIVFFDNDRAGITASAKVKNYINEIQPNKANSLHIPIELYKNSIKDPSDLYNLKGVKYLKKFLKENL